MSPDLEELFMIPVIIVIGIALIAGVWIGGQGGDISWVDDFVTALIGPALLVGGVLVIAAVLLDAL
ncbi:hypothetical protein [Halobacterium sp. KA-6]|uniref:hypothetical protein n=1 Tax=Halobacterium sp. KA-6 TaxID=2896368 RepID=UPI001E3369D8|nr:hypothetical protein [Halobacterium sp. KA-6]MCD2204388.1 hypothetical protein [Halobacterium sp. KA-6]